MSGKRNPGYCIFKEFTIRQQSAAAKVGTDAVLLGSWVNTEGVRRALDIGTGTGVIALMLAQRIPELQIDGMELDPFSAAEAQYNAEQSPWAARVKIMTGNILTLPPSREYDLIVSNPPFFRKGHGRSSPDSRRARGRETCCLDYPGLAAQAPARLVPGGRLAVILPMAEGPEFEALMNEYGFSCRRRTGVSPLPGRPIHRWLLEFAQGAGPCQEESLVLEKKHHTYTPEIIRLTKSFYRGL